MKRTIQTDSAYNILKQAENPILSSKEVAEKMGVSRQYAHQELEDAMERGQVEKISIGPSVGWHITQHWDDQLELDMSSLPIGRAAGNCAECFHIFEDGDEAVCCYERLQNHHSWDLLEMICEEHVENARQAPELVGHTDLIDEGLNKFGTTFGYVKGRVSEETQELEDGREYRTSMLRDAELLTLVKPN